MPGALRNQKEASISHVPCVVDDLKAVKVRETAAGRTGYIGMFKSFERLELFL